ncbi:MAG: hypothetical protein AB7S38_42135 [Vulcanimicrobiota bacterium]
MQVGNLTSSIVSVRRAAANASSDGLAASEEAAFSTFLEYGEGLDSLSRPEYARSLAWLSRQQLDAGKPFATYQGLVEGKLETVEVKYHDLVVGKFVPDLLAKPESLEKMLKPVATSLARLDAASAKALAGEHATSLVERANYLAGLCQRLPSASAQALYQAVAAQPDWSQATGFGTALLDARPDAPGTEWAKAFAHQAELAKWPGNLQAAAQALYLKTFAATGQADKANQEMARWQPALTSLARPELATSLVGLAGSGLEPARVTETLQALSPSGQDARVIDFERLNAGLQDGTASWSLLEKLETRPRNWVKSAPDAVALATQLCPDAQERWQLAARILESNSAKWLGELVGQPSQLFEAQQPWAYARTAAGLGWTESPNGNYAPNLNTSLTTPAIDLAGLQSPRVELRYQCATEAGSDRCHLEVAGEDGQWKSLGSMTGKVSNGFQETELSEFKDQKVRLRLRFSSDSSNQGDGFLLEHMAVSGRTEQGQSVPFWYSAGPRETADVLDRYASLGASQRTDYLAGLKRLMESVERPEAALALSGAVTGNPGDPGYVDECGRLGQLARLTDLSPAIELWPGLHDRPSADLARLGSLCRRAWSDQPSREAGLQRLALANLTSGQLERLERLADSTDALLAGWTVPVGSWGWERDPDHGLVLADSPGGNYGNNQDLALVSPELTIPAELPRLSFERAYVIENGGDKVHLEFCPVGGEWSPLRTYTGKSDWQQESLNLASLAGRKGRLRLRLTTDSSNVYDGIKLAGLRLTGAHDERPIEMPSGGVSLGEVLDSVSRTKPEAREELLAKLELLTPLAGEVGLAMRVMESGGDSETVAMARRFGSQTALELSREFPGLSERSARLAERLHRCLGERPEPTYWGETARQLDAHPEWLEPLEELVGPEPAAANLHSGWGLERAPELGLVWSDSPGRNYADNTDNSLELEPLSLWGKSQGKLSFELTSALEKDGDKLLVEAATHGGAWSTLEKFTGNQPWQRHTVDLSPFDGQKFRLRFRLVSDSSKNFDGVKLNRIRVEAQDSRGNPERLFNFEPGSPHMVDLLDALRADRGLKNSAAHLEVLRGISADLGGFSQAVSLWPVVEKSLEHPQGEAALTAVQKLAQRAGVAMTSQLAPAVLSQPQITPEMSERLGNLGEAAQGLGLESSLLQWLAGRVLLEPDTAKLKGLLSNLGHDQATEILTALQAKARVLEGRVTLAEALGRLAVLRLASENSTTAQLLDSLFAELSRTDFERGEDWLQVGDQVVPVRE